MMIQLISIDLPAKFQTSEEQLLGPAFLGVRG